MWSKSLFLLLALCVVILAALPQLLPQDKQWWIYAVCGFALIILILLFRSVIMPSSTAMHGMNLIAAQDFNNRLAKVGEYNADKIVRLFNSLIDKLRNERLRNLEQDSFLRLLIEASPMGVMMLDFNDEINLINDSMVRILGIASEKDILGQEISHLPADLRDEISRVPLGENRIIRRGDVRMYRCYHLSFIQTGFRRRFYLIESLTEEVMKAEREAYEKVIRIISHEVNNTMGGVKSILELIHDTTPDDDVKEVIESCDDRCERMCEFIRSYAEVVKVPAPVMQTVDLNESIKGMIPFLRGMMGENVKLSMDLQDSLPCVSLDISLMQQVIVNVVKNGIESISHDGFIAIATGLDEGRVWMEISNNGLPISDEVSRKLFSPFFSTKEEGRGLGLTLISEILKRHDAVFSLRTGSDGITRFRIRF